MIRQAEDPCPVGMRGIVPSLNTPFDDKGAIDEASMRRLVELTVDTGCQGILAIAVAGEQASLSPQEKDRLIRIVTETVSGRIPVIMSVTAESAGASCELATIARRAGADGICCQAPAGFGVEDLVAHFRGVADEGPGLLMIQDLDWSGPGLPISTIERLLARIPEFQCLKIETDPAGPKYSAVLEATGGALHVSGGWAARQMIDALERGVHAFMPTAMEARYVAIHAAFAAGEPDRAAQLFEDILPVLDFANRHIDVSIRFFKMLRKAEWTFATDFCRAPVPSLDDGDSRAARNLIAHLAGAGPAP